MAGVQPGAPEPYRAQGAPEPYPLTLTLSPAIYDMYDPTPTLNQVRQKDRLDAAHQRELEAKTSERFSIQPVLDCLTKCVRCIPT